MSDTDQSIYSIRYNQISQGLEGFGGGSPKWTPLILSADGVINQLLTGFVSGAGTVSASDSILSAFQKINGNVAANGLNTISRVTADPSSPTEGTVWYNTTSHLLKYYDGTTVQTVAHV